MFLALIDQFIGSPFALRIRESCDNTLSRYDDTHG